MQLQPTPYSQVSAAGFHAWESPPASAELPCGRWDGSVGLAGLTGRPLVTWELVMFYGTIY